jgi:sugar-specific transcriptional regulator TrmB
MEKNPSVSYLIQAGLREDQAVVYTHLVGRGAIAASKIAKQLSYSRPNIYRLLDELIGFGLIEKTDEPGRVATFSAAHPLVLREWLARERTKYSEREKALENTLTDLISTFTALSGKPGVRVLEGIAGITELYEDILNEQVPICLIRSPYDDQHPELIDKVMNQIQQQVKFGITTRAITPFDNETLEELEVTDKKNLVTRRLVYLHKLDIPAQILLYKDKIALTAFDGTLMTTIIQNVAISKTLQFLFEYLWQTLESEDNEIRSGLLSGTIIAPRQR